MIFVDENGNKKEVDIDKLMAGDKRTVERYKEGLQSVLIHFPEQDFDDIMDNVIHKLLRLQKQYPPEDETNHELNDIINRLEYLTYKVKHNGRA